MFSPSSDVPQLHSFILPCRRRVSRRATRGLDCTQPVTIRIDADVLAWLKSKGKGYQTRINRLLRAAM